MHCPLPTSQIFAAQVSQFEPFILPGTNFYDECCYIQPLAPLSRPDARFTSLFSRALLT